MEQCYCCGVDLLPKTKATPENKQLNKFKSEEHIIPNFCGGFLKSYNLLCRDCNNKLGIELEGELADKMIAARLLSHDIDKGKQPIKYIKGRTDETNTEVLVSRKGWKYPKPHWRFDDNEELVDLRVRSDEAEQLVNGLARKYPNINPTEILERLEYKDIYLEERVNFDDYKFGEKKVHRAMSKIALNYYLYNGYDKKWASELISYVIRNDIEGKFATPYHPFVPIHEIGEDEISHVLYLKGHSKKELLYCYVELYNLYNFLVVINDKYTGEDFEEKYCYDVIQKIELDKNINLSLLYNPLERMQYDQLYNDQHFQQIQPAVKHRFDRFLRLHEKLQV